MGCLPGILQKVVIDIGDGESSTFIHSLDQLSECAREAVNWGILGEHYCMALTRCVTPSVVRLGQTGLSCCSKAQNLAITASPQYQASVGPIALGMTSEIMRWSTEDY